MLKQTFRWSMSILAAVLLAGAGGMLLLRFLGLELLSVQSASMSPAIRRGDAVLVQRDLPIMSPGDIVSFPSREHNGLVITHRIVSIDNRAGIMRTKGDANATADKPVPILDTIGKVNRTIPYGGYVLDAFKHPLGLAALVYVPALCIVIAEIQRLSKHYAETAHKHYYLYNYLR